VLPNSTPDPRITRKKAKSPAVVGVVEIGAKSRHGQAIRANAAKVCQSKIRGRGTKAVRERKRGETERIRTDRSGQRERERGRYTDAAKGISRIS